MPIQITKTTPATGDTGLFVKGEKTTQVDLLDDNGKLKRRFVTGKLNGLGIRAQRGLATEVDDYLAAKWGYDPDKETCKTRKGWAVLDFLRKRGWVLVLTDPNQVLTLDQVVAWEEEDDQFVYDCYKEAIKLNPALNPEAAAMYRIADQEKQGEGETEGDKNDPLA